MDAFGECAYGEALSGPLCGDTPLPVFGGAAGWAVQSYCTVVRGADSEARQVAIKSPTKRGEKPSKPSR